MNPDTIQSCPNPRREGIQQLDLFSVNQTPWGTSYTPNKPDVADSGQTRHPVPLEHYWDRKRKEVCRAFIGFLRGSV